MTRHVRLREFLVGVEGIALMRSLFTGADDAAQRRIDEVRRIVSDAEADTFGLGVDVPILEVGDGYARWSSSYDAPGNPLIAAEQTAVWELFEAAPRGRALDAACGTGRHARQLVALGHEVTGLDATSEMLVRARDNVTGARFVQGDLCNLPFEDGAFDQAVCGLALEHVDDFELAVRELARVVRPDGLMVISDIHPVLRALGGAAYFQDAAGAAGVVRGHTRSHADYLEAFAAADLQLSRCIEPSFQRGGVEMQQPAAAFIPEATEAAYLGLPAVLIWQLRSKTR